MAQEETSTLKIRSWMLAAKVDSRGRGVQLSGDHLTRVHRL